MAAHHNTYDSFKKSEQMNLVQKADQKFGWLYGENLYKGNPGLNPIEEDLKKDLLTGEDKSLFCTFIICSKKEKSRYNLISFLIEEGYIKYAIYFIQKLRVSLSGSAYHLTNLLSTLNSWIPEEGIEPHPHMDLYELSTQLLHLVNSLSEERSFSDTRSSTTPPDNLFFFFLKTLRARKEFGILLMTFPGLILIEDFLVQLSDGTNKPCTLFEISIHFKSPELVIEVIHQLQLRNLLFQEDGSPSEFFNLKRINLISLFFDQPVLYQIIHNVVSDRFPLLAPELLNQFSLNFFCRNTGKLLEKMREQVDLFKILPTDLLTKWKLINPSNIRTTFMKQTLALQKAYYAQCLAEVERLEKAISEKKADLMTKKENQKEVAAKKETLVEALNAVKNQSALELKELEDTLKRDLAPLTDEFEAVSTEKERVKQKLVDLKREIQKTQSECEGLINSQKEVTQRIDAQSRAHEKNIASLEQQISVAQDLLAKTNIPLEAQKNKLDKTKETLAQEKAKNATLFQQLSGLKNALNAAKAETAQRKSELVATEKALGPLVMLYIKEGPKAVSDPTLATCASL